MTLHLTVLPTYNADNHIGIACPSSGAYYESHTPWLTSLTVYLFCLSCAVKQYLQCPLHKAVLARR